MRAFFMLFINRSVDPSHKSSVNKIKEYYENPYKFLKYDRGIIDLNTDLNNCTTKSKGERNHG